MRERGLAWLRWGAVALLVLLAAFFSFLNAGERATVNLGFTVLYRISLVGLVFGAFLCGMIMMFLFGLRYDFKVREALRSHYYPLRDVGPRSPLPLARDSDHPTSPQHREKSPQINYEDGSVHRPPESPDPHDVARESHPGHSDETWITDPPPRED